MSKCRRSIRNFHFLGCGIDRNATLKEREKMSNACVGQMTRIPKPVRVALILIIFIWLKDGESGLQMLDDLL
ncbi:hypothetical protein XI04_18465 [Bradyrhizobium sp. CCBAU 11430]|nr:hypothetical protein [Bradyrhizobium sp. CCBAU 11430]